MELLEHVFSRSGFTDGYFSGRLNSTMFGIRTEEDVRNTSGILGSIAETYKDEAGEFQTFSESDVVEARKKYEYFKDLRNRMRNEDTQER